MMALIAQYGAVIFAALTALVSVWYAGKTKGEANAKVKAAEQRSEDQEAVKVQEIQKTKAAAKAEVETVSKANEALSDVNAMSDDAVFAELRRDYTKD